MEGFIKELRSDLGFGQVCLDKKQGRRHYGQENRTSETVVQPEGTKTKSKPIDVENGF